MSQKLAFTKATKEQAKLRLALFGPSGSGKTYTSLRIASGLSGTIAVIDTERGSASKYADRFEFDVLDLDEKDIDTYCRAIDAAQSAGYAVLILDSLTHAWQELLSEIDKLARAKYGGNTWGAWSEGTPKQRRLVDAILSYDGHVIATMRSKTEWTTTTDNRGRTKPQRIGLAPQQGKGIEYEFDLLIELCVEHIGTVLKDRTGRFQDQTIKEPGEEFGQKLAAWLTEGEPPKPAAKHDNGAVGYEAPTDRPYAPSAVKERLTAIADKGKQGLCTQAQRQLVASKLNECFAGADNADNKRHTVTEWLFGIQSTKLLTMGHVDALIKWVTLDGKKDDTGDYPLHPQASVEAAAIVKRALLDAGQVEMSLDGAE